MLVAGGGESDLKSVNERATVKESGPASGHTQVLPRPQRQAYWLGAVDDSLLCVRCGRGTSLFADCAAIVLT